VQQGFMQGDEKGQIDPNHPVSYAALATVLKRYHAKKG